MDDDTAPLAAGRGRIQRSDYGGSERGTERNSEAKRFERTAAAHTTDARGRGRRAHWARNILEASQSTDKQENMWAWLGDSRYSRNLAHGFSCISVHAHKADEVPTMRIRNTLSKNWKSERIGFNHLLPRPIDAFDVRSQR